MTASPRLSTVTTCTAPGCRRLIMWCVTLNGRRMPLDPDPHDDGNVLVTMLPDGTIRGRVLTGSELPAMVEAYRPHHRTCPGADDYRRREALATAKCRARCGYVMSPWLVEHGYPMHINCLPPISLRAAVDALRGTPPQPAAAPAEQLPGLTQDGAA